MRHFVTRRPAGRHFVPGTYARVFAGAKSQSLVSRGERLRHMAGRMVSINTARPARLGGMVVVVVGCLGTGGGMWRMWGRVWVTFAFAVWDLPLLQRLVSKQKVECHRLLS